jgi:hypothetical protein
MNVIEAYESMKRIRRNYGPWICTQDDPITLSRAGVLANDWEVEDETLEGEKFEVSERELFDAFGLERIDSPDEVNNIIQKLKSGWYK